MRLEEEERCLRAEAELATLERIADDDEARRELLWLRAMEKDDVASAMDLESVDPRLRDRMTDVLVAFAATGGLVGRSRREWFARAWHECYDRHAGIIETACACSRCIECREA
jgi:hypothetical protein